MFKIVFCSSKLAFCIDRVLLPTKVATCVVRLQRQTTMSCRVYSWKRSYRAEIPWILPRELILKGWYHGGSLWETGGCSSMLAMSWAVGTYFLPIDRPCLSALWNHTWSPIESHMKSNRITHEVLENHTLGCCVLLSGKAILILWGNTWTWINSCHGDD